MSNSIASRLLAQRDSVVELAPASEGKPARTVTLRRPSEYEIARMKEISDQTVCQAAVGWSGFTEAVLLGGAVGGDVVVDFDQQAWSVWILDHIDELGACKARLAEVINAKLAEMVALHQAQRVDQAA